MLNVDLSNIWCSVTLPGLLENEQAIAAAHAALSDAEDADFFTWLDGAPDLTRLEKTARSIRDMAQVLVVVGDGGAVLGAQALLALLGGPRNGLEVRFAGSSLSTQAWQGLCERLEGRDFCVQAVGRDRLEIQAAVAFRGLRWLLERRYGTEKARERVFVATDPEDGVLQALSAAESYAAFNLPPMAGGCVSALSPAALLCLTAAGLDLAAVLAGAALARTAMEVRSFENPAWLYASARKILAEKGKTAEYLLTAEPDAWALCRWWQRLMARRCGPLGLLPAAAEIPAELASLWPLLHAPGAPLLETVLRFDPPAQKTAVEMDWKNIDGLNHLEGYTIDYVQEQAVAGFLQAGVDAGVPVITIDCGPLEAASAGALLYFFELSSALEAGLRGRAAVPQGAGAWHSHMRALLERREG